MPLRTILRTMTSTPFQRTKAAALLPLQKQAALSALSAPEFGGSGRITEGSGRMTGASCCQKRASCCRKRGSCHLRTGSAHQNGAFCMIITGFGLQTGRSTWKMTIYSALRRSTPNVWGVCNRPLHRKQAGLGVESAESAASFYSAYSATLQHQVNLGR